MAPLPLFSLYEGEGLPHMLQVSLDTCSDIGGFCQSSSPLLSFDNTQHTHMCTQAHTPLENGSSHSTCTTDMPIMLPP